MARHKELTTKKEMGETYVRGPDGKTTPIWKALQTRRIGFYKLTMGEIRWLRSQEREL